MNLLENAIRSIQIGLEDLDDSTRLISSVRNVHAGVLLLFKENLRRLSPPDSDEVLLKQRIVPKREAGGSLKFVGDGNKTVDIRQIKERFKELGVKVDWKEFDAVTNLRNNVEHYRLEEPLHIVQEIMAKSFVVIRDFVVQELSDDPLSLLGKSSWDKLLSAKNVYDKEKSECVELMSEIPWGASELEVAAQQFKCEVCSSDLVSPESGISGTKDVILMCRSCGHDMPFLECGEGLLKTVFTMETFVARKNGGDSPLQLCPNCNNETFIAVDEQCAVCDYRCEFHECVICNEPIGPDEQGFGGLCGYHNHMKGKAMREDRG